MLKGSIWLNDYFKTNIKTVFTVDLRKLLKCYNVKITNINFEENTIWLIKIYRINKIRINGEEVKIKFKIHEIDKTKIQMEYTIE